MQLTAEQRTELLKEWDADMKQHMSGEERIRRNLKKEIAELKKDSANADTAKIKRTAGKTEKMKARRWSAFLHADEAAHHARLFHIRNRNDKSNAL